MVLLAGIYIWSWTLDLPPSWYSTFAISGGFTGCVIQVYSYQRHSSSHWAVWLPLNLHLQFEQKRWEPRRPNVKLIQWAPYISGVRTWLRELKAIVRQFQSPAAEGFDPTNWATRSRCFGIAIYAICILNYRKRACLHINSAKLSIVRCWVNM